jgi:hypothetical protein
MVHPERDTYKGSRSESDSDQAEGGRNVFGGEQAIGIPERCNGR